MPKDEEGVQEWCRGAFAAKEARLRNFYEGPMLFDKEGAGKTAGRQEGCVAGVGIGKDVNNNNLASVEAIEDHSKKSSLCAFIFFLALVGLIAIGVVGGAWCKWYIVLSAGFFTLVTSIAGGMDNLELMLFEGCLEPLGGSAETRRRKSA
ncbi:unnamed protein product [Choristocarpus tenellus]